MYRFYGLLIWSMCIILGFMCIRFCHSILFINDYWSIDISILCMHFSIKLSIADFSEMEDDFFSQQHSILTEFLQSLWFALISNTDLLCYLFVFINMVASASILALPMPIMVFLWGTLSVPRPSKTFWVSLIAYTEVKYDGWNKMNEKWNWLIFSDCCADKVCGTIWFVVLEELTDSP